jgi:hypothetical protein
VEIPVRHWDTDRLPADLGVRFAMRFYLRRLFILAGLGALAALVPALVVLLHSRLTALVAVLVVILLVAAASLFSRRGPTSTRFPELASMNRQLRGEPVFDVAYAMRRRPGFRRLAPGLGAVAVLAGAAVLIRWLGRW